MNGLVKVIEMLGATVTQLQAENAYLKQQLAIANQVVESGLPVESAGD